MAILGLDTTVKRAIFTGYMALFISYGMFAHLAQVRGIKYNSAALVMSSSCLKLAIAVRMYTMHDGSLEHMSKTIAANHRCFLLYFVPAAAYSIYDNLAYWNLRVFDPATYFLFMQLRLGVVGVIFQWMFEKKLSRHQWMAIGLITLGCVLKGWFDTGSEEDSNNGKKSHSKLSTPTVLNFFLIGVQVFSATFASVYNEVLLKKETACSMNLQNVFMYTHQIILNFVGIVVHGSFSLETFAPVLSPYVLPMILIAASGGIVTSLFLKHLNSVLKAVASALELIFNPVVQLVIFLIPITPATVVAVFMVSFGVYIYSAPDVKGASADKGEKNKDSAIAASALFAKAKTERNGAGYEAEKDEEPLLRGGKGEKGEGASSNFEDLESQSKET